MPDAQVKQDVNKLLVQFDSHVASEEKAFAQMNESLRELNTHIKELHVMYQHEQPKIRTFMETTKLQIEFLSREVADRKVSMEKLYPKLDTLRSKIAANTKDNAVTNAKFLALNGLVIMVVSAVFKFFL